MSALNQEIMHQQEEKQPTRLNKIPTHQGEKGIQKNNRE
jgi:hypothetical protein